MSSQHAEQVKHVADVASLATVVATLNDWLPAFSALLAIIWTLIRIYETRTVQKLLGKSPKTRKQDRE